MGGKVTKEDLEQVACLRDMVKVAKRYTREQAMIAAVYITAVPMRDLDGLSDQEIEDAIIELTFTVLHGL